MISAQRLIEFASDVASGPGGPIRVVWHVVHSYGRMDFVRALRECHTDVAVVSLLPSGGRFGDPDSIVTDFLQLLEDNRSFIEEELDRIQTSPSAPIIFILVSRREFAAGGVPSAGRLPSWLRHVGGLEVELSIKDSMRDLRLASFDSLEVRVNELRACLFEIDVALLKRIRRRLAETQGPRVDLFQNAGLLPRGVDADSVLAKWEQWLQGLSSGDGYRIDVRHGRSPLAMIVRLAAACAPDSLEAKVKLLQEALDLPPDLAPTVLSVLYRPSGFKGPPESAQQLVTATFSAYNFVNASAHPGDYPRYDLGVLVVVSRELRRGLTALGELLRG
jgi:hypothetical protein